MTTITLEGTQALMRHDDCDLILATGGSALVHEAYSSGKPAFGVGPGNVPAYVDRSADVANAARCLVESQTFDNGTICSSEQAIVCDRPGRGRAARGAEGAGSATSARPRRCGSSRPSRCAAS